MGSVVMKSEFLTNSPIDNYPEYEITEYIYCDKCGSFLIEDHTPFATWMKITVGLLIAVLGVAAISVIDRIASSLSSDFLANLLELTTCPICIFIGFVLFIIWMIKGSETGHQCKRCFNTDIDSHHNILDYPAYDESKLDVPDWAIHKHTRVT